MQSGRCEIHCKFTRFSPANTFRKLNIMKNARHTVESCSAMCLVPTRTLPVASIDRDATRSNSMKATGPIEHPTSSTS